jgi:hypothetical protein
MNPENAGRYFSDSFMGAGSVEDNSFRHADICRKERVQLLIPIVDYEFEKLSAADEFSKIRCLIAFQILMLSEQQRINGAPISISKEQYSNT